MAQHFLYGVDIRTVFQQMGGKRVPERVRSDILFYVRFFLVILDELPEALTGHTLTIDVDKQGRLIGQSDHLGADKDHIVAESLDRLGIHGDQSLLIPGAAADYAGSQIDVRNIQVDQLRHPDTGGIQQLQHSFVPVAFCVDAFGLFQQQVHLLAGEDLRELMLPFVRDHLC